MSDTFTRYPIDQLLQWIIAEEKTGSIFGIPKDLFFFPKDSDPFKMDRYQQSLETPIGVAAGPHTQLSQNIIASWLTGARYIELKTVQVLDELEITKPCIKMEDEGYNCEWSQELRLEESYHEYLNAWILLHLLKHKFGWGDPEKLGFIFNMSVGYNLEGIKSEGVQKFLDKMSDCRTEKAEKIERLSRIYPAIKEINIPDCISNNLTISTMHGCPPDEIEKIGRYFIEDRKLQTTIKLNPTLLGPELLRGILNNTLEFEAVVPDEAFEHDLKYPAAVELIQRLQKAASKSKVEFGLKLTNTLETLNQPGNLPENEKMVYLSGRPLHAISINVAARLQDTFKGKLDLSFSAGVDCFNVSRVLACNLKPVTVCSDILKPGGYTRMVQYLEEIEKQIRLLGADSIEGLIIKTAGEEDVTKAAFANLTEYAVTAVHDKRYGKSQFPFENIKTERVLDLFDCTQAPCITTCPTEQDIPGYLGFAAAGKYEEAHRTILETNPFPNLQGKVCDHPCRSKCTRINLDSPLKIREIKRFVAEQYADTSHLNKKQPNGFKVGIIGAGPSGLSCAYFLALEGFSVEVFEAKSKAGGMAVDAIPTFRLDEASLESDIERIKNLGVKIHFNASVDQKQFDSMRETFDYLYIAVGAQKSMDLGIPGETSEGVMDQLDFLSRVRNGQTPDLGNNVVVIGAGNSAMDAARTAKRLVGADGEVSILYRRTRKQMPADHEEIEEAVAEGVHMIELVAPEHIIEKEGRVSGIACSQMKLGIPDDSGRPRPEKVPDSELRFTADTVIPAIGQEIVVDFLAGKQLKIDPESYETELSKVFAGGDAVRGAATLVEAIGDGRRTAENIIKYTMHQERETQSIKHSRLSFADYQKKLAQRKLGLVTGSHYFGSALGFDLISKTLTEDETTAEADRCLSCDLYCAICTTVCPNRANIVFPVNPTDLPQQIAIVENGKVSITTEKSLKITQSLQIINISDFCNECGNCTTFCPTSGDPYKDKPRICLSRLSFDREETGFLLEGNTIYMKENGVESYLVEKNDGLYYNCPSFSTVLDKQTFVTQSVEIKDTEQKEIHLQSVALMGFLLVSLKHHPLFCN